MNLIFIKVIRLTIIGILFVGSATLISQETNVTQYKYISPKPGSRYIMPGNNIAVRHGHPLNPESIENLHFEVTGSVSGKHIGEILLTDDKRTIIFKPSFPFAFNERVFVQMTGSPKTITGLFVLPVDFYFEITPNRVTLDRKILEERFNYPKLPVNKNLPLKDITKSTKNNNLPEDFPEISIVQSNNPSENDYYFVSPFGYWGWFPDNVPYLIIMDYTGVPVFYQKLPAHAYDFKLQQNGYMTYFLNEWSFHKFLVLDSSFQVIDDLGMQNGYITDFHESVVLPNGHAFVMGGDPQIVNMDTVIPGGHPTATVMGWIFQELDQDKNVVFQWRSWDHYQITDADEHVDLYDSIIDAVHGNAIEVYSENTLILSPRNLNEITKIDWNSGEIIWRLGGENNMFEFVNDTLGFSRQHDCRKLSNGNLSIFDNGTYHPEPKFSSCIEYEIDEDNLTATLVRRLRSEPDNYGGIMGSCRETQEGNFIAGWGSGVPAITEFNKNNEIVNEIYIAGINYRVYRNPWETNYFSTNVDTINFGYIWHQDTAVKTFKVINNQEFPIELTSHYSNSEYFEITDDFPVNLEPGEKKDLQLKFKPTSVGDFTGRITLNSDINTTELTQRIARQIIVVGLATENQSIDNLQSLVAVIYPNPAGDFVRIQFEKITSPDITIFNQLGRPMLEQSFADCNELTCDFRSLAGGIYFIKLSDRKSGNYEIKKVVKK